MGHLCRSDPPRGARRTAGQRPLACGARSVRSRCRTAGLGPAPRPGVGHGAHWAIVALALILPVSIGVHINEVITGLIGVASTGAAMISSVRGNPSEDAPESTIQLAGRRPLLDRSATPLRSGADAFEIGFAFVGRKPDRTGASGRRVGRGTKFPGCMLQTSASNRQPQHRPPRRRKSSHKHYTDHQSFSPYVSYLPIYFDIDVEVSRDLQSAVMGQVSDEGATTAADADSTVAASTPSTRRLHPAWGSFAQFLDRHGLGSGDLRLSAIGEGRSNATYLVERDDAQFILRHPPLGPIAPKTHDVCREARILRSLNGVARVPEVLAVCADSSVIGVPFYLMSKVDGHVITTEIPDALDEPPSRRLLGLELVDALAEVHAIDYHGIGLTDLAKPTGYLPRQILRFLQLWEHNKTREIPSVPRIARWLQDHMPPTPATTIVHGDYRLGNVIVSTDRPARVVSILDWELATLGDPLADLGYLCALWVERDDPVVGLFDADAITRREGFVTREELIARYEKRSGHPVHEIHWYQTLAVWKLLILMEGNHKRSLTRISEDAAPDPTGGWVIELARHAEELTKTATN
ncbi:DUF475 domain-containing protein [Nocardia beijingensis]|uniref:phosphotransferase family protein n=1 Tax=Nocardia beijingensis TaxID=95162 RepID=UPI003410098B